jgi:transposase-like protein
VSEFNSNAMRLRLAIDLREIEHLALELHTQALNSPNARDFPGGTALHMLGPAASLAVWEAQYEAVEEAERWDDNGGDRWAKRPKLDPATYQGDDNEQPLNVLESWTRIVREERDQPTDLKATISREVDYLTKAIDWMCAEDENGEPAWPAVFELAAELKNLRRVMEVTLCQHPQRDLGVHCLNGCGEPLLKIWGIDPGTDRYVCTVCHRRYEIEEYHLAVRQAYMLEAEWLSAEDMAAVYRVSSGTVAVWANRGHVTKRIDPNTRRVVYNVAEVIERRDETA